MIEAKINCVGQFRAVTSKDKEGKIVCQDTGFFENLVLNSGFDLLCQYGVSSSSSSIRSFFVGTGTTPPAAGQTTLVAQKASQGVTTSSVTTSNYELGYIQMSVSTQFAQGAAAGNISEFGVGNTGNPLFSRALVVDAQGQPTTITVLSDEFLTVYYVFRVYMPKNDIIQNIDAVIDGVPTPIQITARPMDANGVATIAPAFATPRLNGLLNGSLTTPIGKLNPSVVATSVTPDAYVTGSARRTGVMAFGTADAVGTYNIMVTDFGPLRWQMQFSPALTKTNLQVLNIRFGYQMGRPE